MEYKIFDEKSYKIHTIKMNHYKTSKIQVFFRMPVDENILPKVSFISELLNESSKKYPTRKDVAIKLEDLYQTYYISSCVKLGNVLNLTFDLEFINPEFIDDPKYLKNIIEFLFDMILKPNVKNNEFEESSFKIVKNLIKLDILSLEEDSSRKAINNALITMDKNSSSAYQLLGSLENLEKMTPEDLYDTYNYIMNNSIIDIFVIGNTDLDKIRNIIKDNFHFHHINDNKFSYYIDNKLKRKLLIKEDNSLFIQSQLVVLYNLKDLTFEEKEVTFHLLNYILGSGGLSSKLYRYIRNENSLCYQVSSMYFKYDNLLCISSSLAKENIPKVKKLIDKAIKELKEGIFTDNDLQNAKQNLLLSLNVNEKSPGYILSSYIFKYFIGNLNSEEKKNIIEKITKKDIILLAKKIKENTMYVLSEDENGNN